MNKTLSRKRHSIRSTHTTMKQRDFREDSQKPATTIPIVNEYITVDKEVHETKIEVSKHVREETQTIKIPLVHEGYEVKHVPVNRVVDTLPPIRHEEDTVIIPVVKEVVIIQKKYEVVEEIHMIKQKTTIPHIQEITLLKEEVEIKRTPGRTE
jgi:uncharacterized protein (TIGR02271 family)